jgi:hypothetical protein
VNKDVKRLMGRLAAQGFTYRLSKAGRLVVYRGEEKVSSIPTDTGGLAMRKYVARLERAGFRA